MNRDEHIAWAKQRALDELALCGHMQTPQQVREFVDGIQ